MTNEPYKALINEIDREGGSLERAAHFTFEIMTKWPHGMNRAVLTATLRRALVRSGAITPEIDAALDLIGCEQVALSDIADLQRYTLGGHCDRSASDCGAEMEQDDEGEYLLFIDVLNLGPKP